jgi:hypothetical protein
MLKYVSSPFNTDATIATEALFLYAREEHGLSMSETRLYKYFGYAREDITHGWRKCHNKENFITKGFLVCVLHQIVIRITKSRTNQWMGHVACRREVRN